MQARKLLKCNLENAKASLEVILTDLEFVRDQVTITQVYYKPLQKHYSQQIGNFDFTRNYFQVTIARVYNWDVHQRRMKQATIKTQND